jgi:hypothetical protein
MDWTTLVPPLVGALVGSLSGGGITLLISNREAKSRRKVGLQDAEERSLGLARASARVVYRHLVRQLAVLFAAGEHLRSLEPRIGRHRRATSLTLTIFWSLAKAPELELPPSLDDAFLNARFQPALAADVVAYVGSIEGVRSLSEELAARWGPGATIGDDQARTQIEAVLRLLNDASAKIRAIRPQILDLTGWESDFCPTTAQLSLEMDERGRIGDILQD